MEFVHYLRLYIERMELVKAEEIEGEETPPVTQGYSTKEPSKGVKSQGLLTLPKTRAPPSTTSWEEIEMEEQEERVILSHRMDQMEHVLSQIVQQLQHLSVQGQSQAAPANPQTQ